MMKNIPIIATTLFCILLNAQNRYITRSGNVTFKASVPSFEEIKANHKNTSALLNTNNGELATLILIKGFQFKIVLMQEHFNENYIESDDFPKATFKGKIIDFDYKKLSSNYQKFELEGLLNIHGISKKIKTNAKIKRNAKDILLSGKFKISPIDFNIKIPSIVKNKIAEEILINFNFEMSPK
jgi:hypothetical protein